MVFAAFRVGIHQLILTLVRTFDFILLLALFTGFSVCSLGPELQLLLAALRLVDPVDCFRVLIIQAEFLS